MQTVELQGPFPDWHTGAHRAVLYTDADKAKGRPVLVVLGPETQAPDSLETTRELAAKALGRRGKGVMTLVAIVPLDHRLAWVYEYIDGIGATWLAHREGTEVLGLGAAAEIVADVAETLLEMGPLGVAHPGPTPDDLLIDRLGQVHVASFVSPFAADPVLREPHGRADTSAVVYRLGMLLSSLACGSPPVASSDEKAHEAVVRRVLIRAMARPGNAFTDRYRDWLTGMIAWDPEIRPPLGSVPAGLREIAAGTGDRPLVEWSATMVAELQARVSDPSLDGPYSPWLQSTQENTADEGPTPPMTPIHMTIPGLKLSEIDFEDDPTAESQPSGEKVPSPKPLLPKGRGAIPVGVGPPAEAIREVPRLPEGFLSASQESISQRAAPTPVVADNRTRNALIAVTVVLMALGMASLVYLFVL